jgi:hypothetical protein
MISAPLNKWISGVLSNIQMKPLCKPGWIEGDVIPIPRDNRYNG